MRYQAALRPDQDHYHILNIEAVSNGRAKNSHSFLFSKAHCISSQTLRLIDRCGHPAQRAAASSGQQAIDHYPSLLSLLLKSTRACTNSRAEKLQIPQNHPREGCLLFSRPTTHLCSDSRAEALCQNS
jgi:hypothetical protein